LSEEADSPDIIPSSLRSTPVSAQVRAFPAFPGPRDFT